MPTNFRQDLQDGQDLNVGLCHPVNPVHPVQYICAHIDFGHTPPPPLRSPRALRLSKLFHTIDHKSTILTMKLLPRPLKAENAGRALIVDNADCA